MNKEAVAAFASIGLAVGAAGCGSVAGKTYSYEPTRACLERLGRVGGVRVSVYGGNFTSLGDGWGGSRFMVFFGGDPDGTSGAPANIVYVTVVRSPGEAEQVLRDYTRHAEQGDMGYSRDSVVSRRGNVTFTWSEAPPGRVFKDAFEHCLK